MQNLWWNLGSFSYARLNLVVLPLAWAKYIFL